MQAWCVIWGDSGIELLAYDGPFLPTAQGLGLLSRAYHERKAEGWEIVAMLPWHAWDAMQRGWRAAIEDALELADDGPAPF